MFERGNSLGVHFIEPILTLGEMSRAKKLTGIDTESIFNCAFKNNATKDQDTKIKKTKVGFYEARSKLAISLIQFQCFKYKEICCPYICMLRKVGWASVIIDKQSN